MRTKGFGLLETIISISIACIIIIIACSIYAQSEKYLGVVGDKIDSLENLRIGMDFVEDKLRGSHSVLNESEVITIDGSRVYLKNGILRYNTDGEQIASKISSFGVQKINDKGLYKITLSSNNINMNSLIEVRE